MYMCTAYYMYTVVCGFAAGLSSVNLSIREITHNRFAYFQIVGAMHFIYYINRLTTTKVDSTYLGC